MAAPPLPEFNDLCRATTPEKLSRSSSHGSCCDGDDSGIPEMIMTTSLSTVAESDDGSLSSASRPGTPQRTIFGSYWSSPAHIKSLETNDKDEDELLARLQTVKLPSMDDDDDDTNEENTRGAPADKIVQPPITQPSAEPKKSFDDDKVNYQAALPPTNPRITPRRQILPKPPPPTALSSSLLQPRLRQHLLLTPLGGEGKSFSTSALLGRRHPSCLRKPRYPSCDAAAMRRLHHGLRNDGCPDFQRRRTVTSAAASGSVKPGDLKKSVSFYSQVSVFEFAVPQKERSQKGWDKQFA